MKDEDDFDVPAAVIRCLKHNEVYQLPVHKGLDCAAMFEVLEQWFEDLDDDALAPKVLYEEMRKLFDDNPQVAFGQKVKQLDLEESEELLLVLFCYFLICKGDDDIRFNQMEDVFYSSADFTNAKAELRSNKHSLQTAKLIEYVFFGQEQYVKIRERMQEKGFRQGFTCLFHGGPGRIMR